MSAIKFKLGTGKGVIAGLGSCLGLLAAGGLAWACTVAPPAILLGPRWGPAGSTVTLTGTRFDPSSPVQIHWNTAGGPLLGTAQGADFSSAVVIPANAPKAVGYIVATQSNANGILTAKAPAAFDVSAAPGDAHQVSRGAGEVWSGYRTTGSGYGAGPAGVQPPAPAPMLGLGLSLAGAGAAAAASGLLIAASRKPKRASFQHRNR